MSFFDEIVEAYRYKVGNAQAEVDAARERYDAVREEAAAELAKAALDAPELKLLAGVGSCEYDTLSAALWVVSPGERAEMFLDPVTPDEATLLFAGEDYGRQFRFNAPLEDAVNLFLAWVGGDVDTVTRYGACPEDWAETIGCAS